MCMRAANVHMTPSRLQHIYRLRRFAYPIHDDKAVMNGPPPANVTLLKVSYTRRMGRRRGGRLRLCERVFWIASIAVYTRLAFGLRFQFWFFYLYYRFRMP